MTRSKVTSSDINARLARGECANFTHNSCLGRTPCTVINGEPCSYFATYVKPLLEHPDCSAKYAREAKVTVALNPNSKVVRKRREAGTPALELGTKPATAPAKQPVVKPRAAVNANATREAPQRKTPAAAPSLPLVAEAKPTTRARKTTPAPIPILPAPLPKPVPAAQPPVIAPKVPARTELPAAQPAVADRQRPADPPQLLLELVSDATPSKRRKTRR